MKTQQIQNMEHFQNQEEIMKVREIQKIQIQEVLHIMTIDLNIYIYVQQMEHGNVSETYTQKLEPTNQELEVTKEVVNPKNEYKIGDRVTYKVKFKIKENATNKGKITNVNIVDTYNSNYLRLVNGSIVKDNNTVVNTDEVGKIKTTINELVYGKIKEIRYDMEVLNTANR